ncbi:MAG: MFS transporter [Anaerolineae bacterium]
MVNEDNNWKRPFFTIWVGQQISLLGSMLAGFALIWWVTETTGSATKLATLSLLQMLPSIVLGPFVGALIDRWHRRTVMLVADTIVAIFSGWLAYLFWTNALQMGHVYLIMVVRALGGTFHWSAMSASTSLMVPKDQLARVAGMNQSVHGIWNIISPPLGALLIAALPLHDVMLMDVITAMLAIGPLFFVVIPQPVRRDIDTETAKGFGAILRDMREGLTYVWGWPGLMVLMILASVVNLMLNPAFSLLPLFVTEHFGKGALELGWMNSAWGIGLVVGGLVLSAWGGFKRKIITTQMGLFVMGIAAIVAGIAPPTAFALALGALFLSGAANPITNGPLNAIFQSVIPPEMQGRVFTLIGSAAGAMSPLGMAIAGPVAERFGVTSWFVAGGVVCIVMSIIGLLTPAVMQIEDNYRGRAEEPCGLDAASLTSRAEIA